MESHLEHLLLARGSAIVLSGILCGYLAEGVVGWAVGTPHNSYKKSAYGEGIREGRGNIGGLAPRTVVA